MSAVDEIINYQRSEDEDFYGMLNCTEQATVSVHKCSGFFFLSFSLFFPKINFIYLFKVNNKWKLHLKVFFFFRLKIVRSFFFFICLNLFFNLMNSHLKFPIRNFRQKKKTNENALLIHFPIAVHYNCNQWWRAKCVHCFCNVFFNYDFIFFFF